MDELQFFAVKIVSPDTFAFAQSLRVPSSTSPLISRVFVLAIRAWASTADASFVAARCAVYVTAVQADELEVEEGNRRSIAIKEIIIIFKNIIK